MSNLLLTLTNKVNGSLLTVTSKVNTPIYTLLGNLFPFMKNTIPSGNVAITGISANLKAMLLTIRKFEGTSGVNGYRTMFTGRLFDSFADHPNQVFQSGSLRSNAAGAYQFMKRKDGYGFAPTWDECKATLGLPDFSPLSQDKAAIYLIKRRGALDAIESGNITAALDKLSWEWASIPPSRYGQTKNTKDKVLAAFRGYGGTITN